MAGMPVTWINPSDDPVNESFIKNRLIAKYGKSELSLITVEKRLSGFIVTLERRGEPISDHLEEDNLRRFSWHYLRPVESTQ